MLVPDSLLLLPLAWWAFFALRASNLRTYSASLVAILTLALYAFLVWIIWPGSAIVGFELSLWADAFRRTFCWLFMPVWLLAASAIFTLVGLWSLIAHLQRYSRANVRIQTRVILAAPAFLVALLSVVFPTASGNALIGLLWAVSLYLTVLYLTTYGFPRVNLRGNGGSTTRRLSRRADSQNPFKRKKKQAVYGNSRRSFSRRSRRR